MQLIAAMRRFLCLTALVLAVSAGAVAAEAPPRPIAAYTFHASADQTRLLFKAVRKLTIEEGADLLNDLIQQAGEEERAAANPPAAKP